MTNRACASYWYPRLSLNGVPTPRTEIIQGPDDLWLMLDGERPEGLDKLCADITAAGDRVGWPCFLRTGHFSGKHAWRRSCFVPRFEKVPMHVFHLVEGSHLVDLMGLPTDVWVVREYLPPPPGHFTAFWGMPVRRERRAFIGRDEIVLIPYWPEEAIRNESTPDWRDMLRALNHISDAERQFLVEQSRVVAGHFEGEWSLDWMEHKGIWYAIDMAPAELSWGYPWRSQPWNTC